MKHIFQIFIFLILAVSVCAQGEDGGLKTKPATRPKSNTSAPKSTHAPASKPKSAAKPNAQKPRVAKSVAASLSVSVSEPQSEIFLKDSKGNVIGDENPVFSPPDGSAYVFDALPAGVYSLVVRKDGYFEETKQVKIIAQKTTPVAITLRASMAFLTITTVPPDAVVEIESIGNFPANPQRYSIKTGTYKMKVSRKGYITDTRDISLSNAGLETTQIIKLDRVPTGPMLAEAESGLAAGNYDAAVNLCTQIIEIEPNNQLAYLVRGKAMFLQGASGAGASMLDGIRLGGTVTLPVSLYNKDGKGQLISGDLTVDRYYVQFSSRSRPERNFLISKADVNGLSKKFDKQNMTYTSFNGAANVNGKRVRLTVTAYSERTALRQGKNEVFCPAAAYGPARCDSDIDNLYVLMAGWLTPR